MDEIIFRGIVVFCLSYLVTADIIETHKRNKKKGN